MTLLASDPGIDSTATPHRNSAGLIWLTWRQQRWAIIGTLVLAAVLAGVMIYLALRFTDLYHQCHDTMCPPNSPQGNQLGGSTSLIMTYSAIERLVEYVPMLVGLFLGVPLLSREHEQRTLVLAWSQDVSPSRWLWTKLGVLGLFVAAVTAVIAAASDHMENALYLVAGGSEFQYLIFMNTAMLPLVVGLCWFALGVALGAVIRRTLPAVFSVLAGFVGLTYLVQWRYPTLMKPLVLRLAAGHPGSGRLADSLIVKGGMIQYDPGSPSAVYDGSGRQLSGAELQKLCPPGPSWSKTVACFGSHHLQQYIQYQPAGRIPEFHLIVASGYAGLAVLAVTAVWWVVRRTDVNAG